MQKNGETPKNPTRAGARQRLLAAAAQVFARDGLAGATTRVIADEAGVNEVTLFRLFGSKEKLLSAVVGETFGRCNPLDDMALPAFTGNLRSDLILYARHYEKVLGDNLLLVRTFIGEIQHHRECERQVLQGIFGPVKARLVERLEQARARGEIRHDIDVTILTDLFIGMLFTGVIRRASPVLKRGYTAAKYRESAVEFVLRAADA